MEQSVYDQYELVVGLEVHMQLKTASKAYASDANLFGALPNTLVSPITLGHPGTLPKVNTQSVDCAIKLALATDMQINTPVFFARKNYFYADLPKGYQITQDKTPICTGGEIIIREDDGSEKRIGITRAHLEEDAGKSMHDQDPFDTLVDLNRAGVPLIEVVSEPDMRTSREAYLYLTEVRKLVRYLDICDGNMEEGSLRCDANISVRPVGSTEFGAKVEVKNMNSMRHVQKAIEYEYQRQCEAVERGERIVSETRSFDPQAQNTFALRSKEAANDYRYFPEPDLPPILVTPSVIDGIQSKMPPLPAALMAQFTNELGLSAYDAGVLCDQKELALWFLSLISGTTHTKQAANWTMGPVKTWLNARALPISDLPISAASLAQLINAVQEGKLSHHQAVQQVWPAWLEQPNRSIQDLLKDLGLEGGTVEDDLPALVQEVLASMPAKVQEYRDGKKGLLALFMGEIMKRTGGRAQPARASALLQEALN